MAVSIHDIAERANVSITTVSRVLNHNESVRESTRQRVEEIIKACDYRPNIFARGLMLKRTDNLGLILPMGQGELASGFIRGANVQARRLGQGLMVSSYETPVGACQLLSELAGRCWIDGVAVMMNDLTSQFWDAIHQLRLPVTVINLDASNRSVDHVRIDHYAGACLLVRHLIEEHHVKKPLFLASAASHVDTLHRTRAFRDLTTEHGLTNGTDRIYRIKDDYDGAKAFVANRLGGNGLDFDAIVADSSPIACGAMAAARDAGIDIPDQLKVVGFDEADVSAWVQPAMTTVTLPIRQAGEKAIEVLHQRVRQPDLEPQRITLRPQLVVRQSCGCRANGPG